MIHTKSRQLERSIVDSLASLLLPERFTIWGYADWDWKERRRDEPTWEDRLATGGFLLQNEEEEAINGPRPRFAPPVDRTKLDSIFLKTRVVVFLNPVRGILSDGMKEELFSLRRLQRLRRFHEKREFPAPVCIWCNLGKEKRDPYPLHSLGDGDVVWGDSLDIEVGDESMTFRSSLAIALSAVARLIEQRAMFVRQLMTQPRSTMMLSHFFCSADEELARCSRICAVGETCVRSGNANEVVQRSLETLKGLLGRYDSSALDWSRWNWWQP